MYLIDTNVLIYAFLGKEPYSSLLINWTVNQQLALSVVPVSEFLVGADQEETERLELFMEYVKIIPIELSIAKTAAKYRKQYARKKKIPYLLDCYLAATAKVYELKLVTRNKKDFPMKDITIIDPLKIKPASGKKS